MLEEAAAMPNMPGPEALGQQRFDRLLNEL
jgi:hypothetical protein